VSLWRRVCDSSVYARIIYKYIYCIYIWVGTSRKIIIYFYMATSADLYTLWSVVCETAYTDAPPPRRHRPPSFRAAVYNNNNNNNMIVSDGRTGIMTRVRQFSTAADNTTCCNAARVYNIIIMHMYTYNCI